MDFDIFFVLINSIGNVYYEIKMRNNIVLSEICLICVQRLHVRIFMTPPFSVYPDSISYGMLS